MPHHHALQPGVQPGYQPGEEGCGGRPCVHHRSRQAGACPAEHRGIPAPDQRPWRASSTPGPYLPGIEDMELEIPSTSEPARAARFHADVSARHQCHFRAAEGPRRERPIRHSRRGGSGASPPASLFLSPSSSRNWRSEILLAERRDPAKGALLRVWLDEHVLPGFADRILPVDTAVAHRSARYTCQILGHSGTR